MTVINYVFLIYLSFHSSIIKGCCQGWTAPVWFWMGCSYFTSHLVFFLFVLNEIKEKAQSTHPLFTNGTSSLNIEIPTMVGQSWVPTKLQQCLWTLCQWILLKSFFKHTTFCGSLICVSLTLRRCQPQKDQICLLCATAAQALHALLTLSLWRKKMDIKTYSCSFVFFFPQCRSSV